jgi:acetylornithine deacetylase/succinyl-diaminopimelate desuccinylase-like protein
VIIDRRTTPSEDITQAREEFHGVVNAVAQEDPQVNPEIVEINLREGTRIASNHPWVTEVKEIYEGVIHGDVPTYGTPGSADMCYQINQGRWPCVGLGCGGSYSRGHGIDENVKISEVVDLTKVLATVIMQKLALR